MRVLVTGGGGFLGGALAKALAARGDQAIVFDIRIPPGIAESKDANIVAYEGDVTDMANLCQVFRRERPEAVLHCAAIVGIIASLGSPQNVLRINVEGAVNLFEAMRLFDVRRVIHVSSEETYGHFASPVITEDHPQNPIYPYGITKLTVEHLGRTYALLHGIECINVRTSWVYGPGLPRVRVPRDLVEAAVEGRSLHLPWGGESAIDHTYVEDFVAGALAALDHPAHPYDAYHVASGSAPTLRDMVGVVKKLVPGSDLSVGPGLYRYAGRVEIPRKGALDCARAREVFGYEPRFDLRAGLEAYVAAQRRLKSAS